MLLATTTACRRPRGRREEAARGSASSTSSTCAPEARRRGVAAELVREAASALREQRRRGARARGARSRTSGARAVYERWGFSPVELTLAAPIDALVRAARLRDGRARRSAPSTSRPTTWPPSSARCRRCCRGSAARRAPRSTGPDNGWVTVHDELGDRDPKRLAASRQGAVVCERRRRARARRRGRRARALHARRPRLESSTSTRRCRSTTGRCRPATSIALGANPTVVSRLTGADPARVREIARTGASPADLPPALELHRADRRARWACAC